jgi:2-hydroxychromene-2-carboxylate isomerase
MLRMKTIEFYFDFGSPTAYLAWTQLPQLAAAAGAELVYKPVLLGGIFQATHNASPMMVPAKGKYMLSDLARFARRYGVTLNMNPHFPINTLQMMRGAVGLQARMPERFGAYVEALYRGMWVEQLNLNDPAVLGTTLARAGFEPQAMLALIGDPQVKELLKSETEAAVQRGLFGVPVMFVGGEMYFGQDRLDFVREALAA